MWEKKLGVLMNILVKSVYGYWYFDCKLFLDKLYYYFKFYIFILNV